MKRLLTSVLHLSALLMISVMILCWTSSSSEAQTFLRGDADGSGVLDISDPVYNLTPQFLGGLDPICLDALDDDDSGVVDISDAMFTLLYLFLNGVEPACLEAANANGSRTLNIADPIFTFQFLFNGGGAPPHPFPLCRLAPTPLTCTPPGFCLTPLPEEET